MFKNYKNDGSGYVLSPKPKNNTNAVPVLTQKERLEKIIEKIKTLKK